MRKFSTFAFVAGLAVWVSVGLANDAVAGMHGKASMSSGQADSMMGNSYIMPFMNSARGRMLFASKGCMVCHSINGVGGTDAPALDASTMPRPMNIFDFSAKMWLGAEAMIMMQRGELGEQIEFTGAELADIIAFVHDPVEQKKFSAEDAPPRIKELISHMGGETEQHEKVEHGD